MQLTAHEIAQIAGGELVGDPNQMITGVAGIREAQPGDLSFIASPKYYSVLKTTKASVVIVAPDAKVEFERTLVRAKLPEQAFTKIVMFVMPPPVQPVAGCHPSAVISPSAKLGKDISVQPHAVIEEGVVIGNRTIVGAGSVVAPHCRVGDDCRLYAHVTLRESTVLGNRVILHSGVVIGTDGFGYAIVDGKHQKIPQVGTVEIGDDVEIGSNTAIDRARFGKTRVGRGTKIDNLVQIGHNCVIGEDCIICGLVGIAGSVIVGHHVTIAGQVGIAGHITIGDNSILMAKAGVTKDVPPGSFMLGQPAVPHTEFKRINAALHRLPDTASKVREIEQILTELQATLR